MSLDSLADAFYDELCDVYHAEKQLLKPVYQIYDWSPDVGPLSLHSEGTSKSISPDDRKHFEQALFAATAGARGNNVQDDLLPYLESST